MKKNIITALLVFALGGQSYRAQASVPGGICIVAGVGIGIGFIYYTAKRCEKKWYCVHLNEDTEQPPSRKCVKTTPREMRLNNETALAGPFTSSAACYEPCVNYTNAVGLTSFDDEEEIPLMVVVQVSTNMIHWTGVATNYNMQLYFDTETVVYEHAITNGPPARFARLLVFE